MSWINGQYTNQTSTGNLPPQMIPLRKKTKEWKQMCMDALESLGRQQLGRNYCYIENYEMLKGRFIFSQYYDDPGYGSMIQNLTQEFEIPNYLRHYDILSPVINTMMDEWAKRPDVYRVKGFDEGTINAFEQEKTRLLQEYAVETIKMNIQKAIVESGLADAQPQTEEEAQEIQQRIQGIQKAMTPPQIEKYMQTDFFTGAEIWGQHQLEVDRQKYRLDEKEQEEFYDYLVTGCCFRHHYLSSNGYDIETWKPVNTFYHKSREVRHVEDGDYVGRIFRLTLADIIDRYGFLMKKSELEKLVDIDHSERTKWNETPGSEYTYKEYMVPFQGYQAYSIVNSTSTPFQIKYNGDNDIPVMDFDSINNQYNYGNGYYEVTEAYWKSHEKIGLVTYADPQTGETVKTLVDEHVALPDTIKSRSSLFTDEDEVNTVRWTWVNRVWKGIKINLGSNFASLYIDVKPLEFQFKGDINIYGCKLPVVGLTEDSSFMELAKPHQIGYNLCMNQAYHFAEKEIGAFVVMDVNMFPNSKDWGGEDSWEKWMTVAKSLGMLPIDTSPSNTRSALSATGGQFPKIVDLDFGAKMVSRINLAKFFEDQALKQVGFNDYRLGGYTSSATATGVQQGVNQSYAQTGSYFTKFSNYLRRCKRANLDVSQFVQSQQKDIRLTYTKSDLSRAYIKIVGTDLLGADLGVHITDSNEELRKIEMVRRLALENNTAGATMGELADVIHMNSSEEIRAALKAADAKREEKEMAVLEQQERNNQTQREIAEFEQAKEDERADKDNATKIEVAQINASSRVFFNRNFEPTDEQSEAATDNLKEQELAHKIKKENSDVELKKSIAERQLDQKDRELDLEELKIREELSDQYTDLEYAKIMKGKNKS